MKKYYLSLLLIVTILFQACTNSATNAKKDNKENEVSKTSFVDTLSVANTQRKEITEDQFLTKVENYINKNKKKYVGEYESTDVKSGDYDGDNIKDFVATVHFHEGGSDYFTNYYFYQSSTNDELISLIIPSVGTDKKFSVRKIEKEKVFVTFFIGDADLGEKDFNSTVQIEKDKIIFKESDIEKADKIMNELMIEYSHTQME